MKKLDAFESDILTTYEKGEFKSTSPAKSKLAGGFKSEVQPRYDASVASSRRLRGVF